MHAPLKQLHRRGKAAFTLIEILVASAVMIVLVGLVIQITSDVLNVWNRSTGKLTANAEARIVMDLLSQDLEAAVLRNDGLRWMEARQIELGDPFGGNSSFQTTELKLFAPAVDRPEGPGDICGISYLLRYSDPIDGARSGNNRTFILYRNVISPEITFNQLLGAGNQASLAQSQWNESATIGGGDNYLAANIIDFRIDFYVEGAPTDPPTVELRFPEGSDLLFGGSGATAGSGAAGAPQPQYARPLAYADITLRIISDEALQVIQNDAVDQMGFDTDEDYVNANAEVYLRRVNFSARPF